MAPGPVMCPVYEISREDFRRPFSKWVGDVFRANPDLPMFKVVPPKGWSPRFDSGPVELDDIDIQTPITQHAFGTRGTYRCVLVENKGMKVREFRARAETEEHMPPKKGHEDDTLLERAFWSSITINPPMYGSDNPWSLFDKKLRWGWNLRDLGDMLQDPRVASIPGVNTPMVYFGMWKSFFSWHTEDCDLFSINYLHTGAPKAWYCISPADRPKFEAMARKEFPALYANCKGFMRHKDLMFSPSMLRTHNVPFMQAKQEEGEFIVLNAGAYHAGFNMGFNCAEAINFALPEWLPHGCAAVPCKCRALSDAVRIDMRLWCPDFQPEPDPEELREAEEAAMAALSSSSSDEGEDGGEEVQQPGTPPPQQPRKRRGAATKPGKLGRPRKGDAVGGKGKGKASGGVAKRTAGKKQLKAAAGAKPKRRSRATGRPVGRPRKDGRPAGSGKKSATEGAMPPAKNKGGRPRKVDTTAPATEAKSKAVVKNKGGRPRKVDTVSASAGVLARKPTARSLKGSESSGPAAGRVLKTGAGAGKRVLGAPPSGPAPLPAYLQPAASRAAAAAKAGQAGKGRVSDRAARAGRRTATSAAAGGKRALRSTVPVLPRDVGLPAKAPRTSGAAARRTVAATTATPSAEALPAVSPVQPPITPAETAASVVPPAASTPQQPVPCSSTASATLPLAQPVALTTPQAIPAPQQAVATQALPVVQPVVPVALPHHHPQAIFAVPALLPSSQPAL